MFSLLLSSCASQGNVKAGRSMHDSNVKYAEFALYDENSSDEDKAKARQKLADLECDTVKFDTYEQTQGSANTKYKAAMAAFSKCWDKKGYIIKDVKSINAYTRAPKR
jgi:hypothetical protein